MVNNGCLESQDELIGAFRLSHSIPRNAGTTQAAKKPISQAELANRVRDMLD